MPTENAARMLIADDDPNLLDAYVLFFSAQGYDIQTAGDGVEALDAYRAWRPGVVVLDIQMPLMDGREVAREIRRLQSTPFPLLVAATALASPSEQAESIRSGFDHHLVKPIKLPLLLTTIATGRQSGKDSAP
ncbi:response regulator [Paraburkholderia phenazinium]|uniref:Response regulator receiver domain-containing protein n=1 Tax=Paraburkholderia phenazinium TaxID=60549 RepID=A0A1N6HSB7_9BURK|nr:response regulator [Paraburkholderia phenazinium]SIO22687.1 Response regulator receiver domain-containing protein [Paraburkholderia phenazinium]